MAILAPLYTIVVNKLLLSGTSNLTINVKVFIMSKVFLFAVINIFIISFTIRVNISYLGVLPTLYYNYCSYLSLDLKNYLYYNPIMSMMPNNQMRAGKTNGAVFVSDPLSQNYVYNPNGNNQPLLGNIGRGLEAQRLLGLSSLSKFTFTPDQEHYVLSFLLYNHGDIYNNIMQGQGGNPNEPMW
jgi:hypothetical protein